MKAERLKKVPAGIALTVCCLVLSTKVGTGQAIASELPAEPTEPAQCAAQDSTLPQDLLTLTAQLMLDLPSYGNRVVQRASRIGDSTQLYLITAGQARVESVSLAALGDASEQSRLPEPALSSTAEQSEDEALYQIFFTTLERQYLQPALRSPLPNPPGAAQPVPEQAIAQALDRIAPSQQQFHWLILGRQQDTAPDDALSDRPTASPWRILSLRSKLVPYPAADQLLSPARNSRQGAIGQGIALWLRDWHSGTIRFNADGMRSRLNCAGNQEAGNPL